MCAKQSPTNSATGTKACDITSPLAEVQRPLTPLKNDIITIHDSDSDDGDYLPWDITNSSMRSELQSPFSDKKSCSITERVNLVQSHSNTALPVSKTESSKYQLCSKECTFETQRFPMKNTTPTLRGETKRRRRNRVSSFPPLPSSSVFCFCSQD